MGQLGKFTTQRKNKVYKAIREGLNYKISALAAGIGKSTLHRWRAKAKACHESEQWQEVDAKYDIKSESEFQEFREFWDQLTRAETIGETTRAARIAKAGRGGYKQTEERVTVRDAITPQGQIVTLNEKTVITRKIAPDWRADAWVQERRHPERWAKKNQHEISGPDGGAIKVDSPQPDLSKLSTDELEELVRIARRFEGDASRDEAERQDL